MNEMLTIQIVQKLQEIYYATFKKEIAVDDTLLADELAYGLRADEFPAAAHKANELLATQTTKNEPDISAVVVAWPHKV